MNGPSPEDGCIDKLEMALPLTQHTKVLGCSTQRDGLCVHHCGSVGIANLELRHRLCEETKAKCSALQSPA